MRHSTVGLAWAAIGTLLLVACGGGGTSGGGSSSSSGGGSNARPTANAGTNQTVISGDTVTLNGTASSDPDGSIVSYTWTQTAGVPVLTLTNPGTAQPTFVAPAVATATTYVFSLTVTDNRVSTSAPSTVSILVNPQVAGTSSVSGRITFERVTFAAANPNGLDYANPIQLPARGVQVRAINAANQTVIITGSTDADGNYSLTVPASTNVTIEALARMVRAAPQALPRWDVRVQEGTTANATLYTYTDGVQVNSGPVGATHDLRIPTGISASGTASGARPSGPFAMLDTIYKGIEKVRTVSPTADFPALFINWGAQNEGTFFNITTGGQPYIAVLSKLDEDTDEFDEHVVAHEFGHYIENFFSRSDSLGGAHAIGNRLDVRVAWGEGFGTGLAAIMLDSPNYRDSFTDTGGVRRSTLYNIESNPDATSACWCSETTVWALLWDLYDNTPAEANDTVALGFQPLWNVMVGAQRTTPAVTSIFSFVTALKAALPAGDAAAVTTLVASQNIDAASIDAYATGETHSPTAALPQAAALPLFTPISVPGTVSGLLTVNDAGRFNKLGNHRLLRFTIVGTRTTTITLNTSNPSTPDPDFLLFRQGTLIGGANAGQSPPPPPESFQYNLSAGDYVLDVYDCANGCSEEEGTPGDYNLTVTIN